MQRRGVRHHHHENHGEQIGCEQGFGQGVVGQDVERSFAHGAGHGVHRGERFRAHHEQSRIGGAQHVETIAHEKVNIFKRVTCKEVVYAGNPLSVRHGLGRFYAAAGGVERFESEEHGVDRGQHDVVEHDSRASQGEVQTIYDVVDRAARVSRQVFRRRVRRGESQNGHEGERHVGVDAHQTVARHQQRRNLVRRARHQRHLVYRKTVVESRIRHAHRDDDRAICDGRTGVAQTTRRSKRSRDERDVFRVLARDTERRTLRRIPPTSVGDLQTTIKNVSKYAIHF